jgi:hypothetical protein
MLRSNGIALILYRVVVALVDLFLDGSDNSISSSLVSCFSRSCAAELACSLFLAFQRVGF